MKQYLYEESDNTAIISQYKDEYFTNPYRTQPGTYMRDRSTEKTNMTFKNLKKSSANKFKEIKKLDIDVSKCVYITLTTEHIWTWDEMQQKFASFMKTINYHFPHTLYIRKNEFAELDMRQHIHVLLIFKECIPEKLNKEFLSSAWTFGYVYRKSFGLNNLLRYFCKVEKDKVLLNGSSTLTKYPYGARVLTWSPTIPKKTFKSEIIDNLEVSNRLSDFIDAHDGKKPQVTTITQLYLDNNDQLQEHFIREYYDY